MRCLASLAAVTLVLSWTTDAHADVSEKRFKKAVANLDHEKLGRYLEKGVPDELAQWGLETMVRRQSKEGTALFARRALPDEATMRLALERGNLEILRILAAAGGRFTDKQVLYDLIEKKNEKLAIAVLEAGDGLHEPQLVTGLRPLEWNDGKIIAEKYVEPAMSALYLALESGLEDLAQKLIEAGSDPALVIHETPGQAKGVDLDAMSVGERITLEGEAQSSFSYPGRSTMLVNAVRDTDVEWVTRLLDAGAPVAIAGDVRDLDACFFALKRPRELSDVVLRLCPWYELHQAVWRQDAEDVRAALDKGIDPNVADYDHQTALHIASSLGNVELIELLAARGARLNPPIGRFGEPPLHRAVSRGHVDAVRALLRAGADVNAQDSRGDRAVHEAQKVEVLRELVAGGADITATDQQGVNAMVRANEFGDFAIVDYLRSRGLEYGPAFAADDPSAERYERTSNDGHPKEMVLADVNQGRLLLRGQLAGGKVTEVSCRLSDAVRDAHYFHAPSLAKGRGLPPTRPFKTLEDRHLEKYVGTVVRIGAVKGACISLRLPTADRIETDVATPEQLEAAMKNVEVRGELFRMLTTGRATMVFPGTLRSIQDAVVTVEVGGGLKVRCKLHSKTGGIVYGLASILERTLAGDPRARNLQADDVIEDEDIREFIGKPVKVGPGTGRCEYFELIDGE